MIKKFFSNHIVQIVLGMILSGAGVFGSFILSVGFAIQYAGFDLPFGLPGIPGDGLKKTFLLTSFFSSLTYAFPTIIWMALYKLGSFKNLKWWVKILFLVVFATLPFIMYWGYYIFSEYINPLI